MVDVTYELLGPTALPGASQLKNTSRPGKDSGMLRFCVMAGLQSSPTMVVLRQLSLWGTVVWLRGFDPVVASPYPELLALIRAGFGWLRTVRAGKFCHARRVWFAGQELIYGASNVQAQL